MNREVYIWVGIVAVIIGAALYLRLFYQPAISISLGIESSAPAQMYPFQKASFTITAFNNGSSAINNMSLGVDVNGNLTNTYRITLPAGKQTSFAFNYSPTIPGTYTVSVVADPGKLYNLVDRSKSEAEASISVSAAEAADPSLFIPIENMTSFETANLSNGGYVIGATLSDQYKVSALALVKDAQINRFIRPIFDLTTGYIRNISVAQAGYANGTGAYSIWIRGYLTPHIFQVATVGSGLSSVAFETLAGNTTFVKLRGNDSTLCAWYAGGWTKVLAENGIGSCYKIVNSTFLVNTTGISVLPIPSRIAKNMVISNSLNLANYSGTNSSGAYLARLWLVRNSSFMYIRVDNNSKSNNTCIGLIGSINGTSYCSTFIFPASNKIGNFSLIRTTAYKGKYNISAFSLVNTSYVTLQSAVAESILQHLNVSGTSLVFKSGIVNTCSFNQTFLCNNLTYANGSVTFRLTDNLTKSIKLNEVRCFYLAGVVGFPLNATLAPGQATNISATCYSFSQKLGGLVLNKHLTLSINYTVSNSSHIGIGSAFIPLG